jgi:hypothetical protein
MDLINGSMLLLKTDEFVSVSFIDDKTNKMQ